MTKLKWTYVARGHYSTPATGGWTTHVLTSGIVYKTHPTHKTADITGAKADKYIESAQAKFPVRGKRRAEPAQEPEGGRVTPAKVSEKPTKPKKRMTKKQISAAAKKLAKGAGAIIGTTRAFATEVGEAEERTYAKRKAPPLTKKVTKKMVKPPAGGRPTIVRKKKVKPPSRRAPETEHPLEYLMSGTGALPPTGRKRTAKKRRGQTLEEYLGL